MKSINLAEKLSPFSEHFKPRTVGQFNGHGLMVAYREAYQQHAPDALREHEALSSLWRNPGI